MNFKEKVMQFLNLKEEDLSPLLLPLDALDYGHPSDFKEMDKAIFLVKEALAEKQKIMIYGDYDVDGIMATSILVSFLKRYSDLIGYYIPSRTVDGYGITLERARQIAEKGYQLIITVDNGVHQFEALQFLHEKGVKILLTDHHSYGNELAFHDAFLHPYEKDVPEDQCGAYVAYMLVEGLAECRDDRLLSYAALATISDMMPLRNKNRNLVRLGISIVNNDPIHPFRFLTKNKEFDEETFGFQIAPKINSFGRMKEDLSVSRTIKLFVDSPYETKMQISREMDSLNTKRKQILKNAEENLEIQEGMGIVAIHSSLKEGLIGLLAAKMMSTFHKPAMALLLKNGIYKGSIRSLNGAPLTEFFPLISSKLITYGGHEMAGGISFLEENLFSVREAFENFLKTHPYQEEKRIPIEIEKEDVTLENYLFLKQLAPFGKDFEEPLFSLTLDSSECKIFSDHIKADLNINASLIGFSLKDHWKEPKMKFLGHLKKDTYNEGKIVFQSFEIVEEFR